MDENLMLALGIGLGYLLLTDSPLIKPITGVFMSTPSTPGTFDKLEPVPPMPSNWQLPAAADPYLSTINQATRNHKLPPKLLGRLLYQESRFRPDIISGKTISSAGAIGIAQIVPKWHPNVNPRDPHASIHYAGFYLAQLQKQFGNWKDALAAYNWGPGNLGKFKKGQLKTMPKETINYVAQISRDVPVV
jgi:soluble lytic murein transglycosylase-like protein